MGNAINSIPIFVIANLMDEIPRCVSSFRFIENRYRCMLSREQLSPLFSIAYQHRLSVKVLLCRLVVFEYHLRLDYVRAEKANIAIVLAVSLAGE